jgi:hypothetical protein
MPDVLQIKIKKAFANGRLKLKYGFLDLLDAEDAKAKRTDFVRWENKTRVVQTIENIEPKPHSYNIFSIDPHRQTDDLWTAEISSSAPDHAQYIYTVWWRDKEGNLQRHDPKITIKPSAGGFSGFEKIAIGATVAIAGLSLLIFLGAKKWRK